MVGENLIGKLIYYYDNGQRVGYLESIKGKEAKIRPVPAYKASKPNLITIPLKDTEEITNIYAQQREVEIGEEAADVPSRKKIVRRKG